MSVSERDKWEARERQRRIDEDDRHMWRRFFGVLAVTTAFWFVYVLAMIGFDTVTR